MTLKINRRNALAVCVAVCLVPIVCAAVYVPVQQHLLRWRAQRLLGDIRSIQMGKSSWADAQRVMYHWGKWGKWEGTCDAKHCDYQIVLEDAFRAHPTIYVSGDEFHERSPGRQCCQWLRKPYMIFGGRFTEVYASFIMKNGVVWTKSFALSTDLYPDHQIQYVSAGDDLVASAYAVTRFPLHDKQRFANHYEYQVDALGTCSGCRFINATLTPFTDASIVEQLFDFNLDCISRWQECEDPGDIMPSAWRLFQGQKTASPLGLHDIEPCEIQPEIAARDAKYIGIAEVTDTRMTDEGRWSRQIVALRSLANLKNKAFAKAQVELGERVPFAPEYYPSRTDRNNLRRGDKLILLFDSKFDEADSIFRGPDECGFLKYNVSNLNEVQQGIRRDVLWGQ